MPNYFHKALLRDELENSVGNEDLNGFFVMMNVSLTLILLNKSPSLILEKMMPLSLDMKISYSYLTKGERNALNSLRDDTSIYYLRD